MKAADGATHVGPHLLHGPAHPRFRIAQAMQQCQELALVRGTIMLEPDGSRIGVDPHAGNPGEFLYAMPDGTGASATLQVVHMDGT